MTTDPAAGLSVVIPARNAESTLAHQLAALSAEELDAPWEVIVVDDGSTDATAGLARSWEDRLPALRVIAGPGDQGVNGARRRGADAARFDNLAFCDADDVVAPGWLAAAFAGLREHDAISGPLDGSALNDPAVLAWRSHIPTDRLPSGWSWLPFMHGCNFAVRRDALDAAGGFDHTYVGGGDDVSLSWRIQLAGRAIGFVPALQVRYRHRAEVRSLIRQMYRFGVQDAHLYRDFRGEGMPRTSPHDLLRTWGKIARHALRGIWQVGDRNRALGLLARQVGRVAGSWRYRVRYL